MDSTAVTVTIAAGGLSAPWQTTVHDLRHNPAMWRRMHLANWNAVPASLREEGLDNNSHAAGRSHARQCQRGRTHGRADVSPGGIRRLIAVRQRQIALRRGGVAFLATGNPAVLAFVRHTSSQRVLVVANLSGSPAKATLEIGGSDVPVGVDLLDSTHATAPIPDVPYSMTLAHYATRWLSLVPAFEATP